jgi:nitrite reductase (NADH) large subunit
MGAGEHYVIIGNGVAGNRAAEVLREGDPEARVTIVSDESQPFYYRHRLRDLVTGAVGEDRLGVRPLSWWTDRRIRLRLGQRVQRIDFGARTIYLAHREKLGYTRLVVCAGSKPRVPETLWASRAHLTVMKTIEDARALRDRFGDVRHVLVAGGDMVSVRTAAAFLKAGRKVTFLVDRDAFWPIEPGPGQRAELAEALRSRGAEVIEDDAVVAVEPVGEARDVTLRSGRTVRCDVAGAFFGLVPDIDFLTGSGLDVERGILVDEHLRTSVDGVWAAGDCAQVYNPDLRNWWVSVGWGNAERLGEVAARNVLGDAVRATGPAESVLRCEGVVVATRWWVDRP